MQRTSYNHSLFCHSGNSRTTSPVMSPILKSMGLRTKQQSYSRLSVRIDEYQNRVVSMFLVFKNNGKDTHNVVALLTDVGKVDLLNVSDWLKNKCRQGWSTFTIEVRSSAYLDGFLGLRMVHNNAVSFDLSHSFHRGSRCTDQKASDSAAEILARELAKVWMTDIWSIALDAVSGAAILMLQLLIPGQPRTIAGPSNPALLIELMPDSIIELAIDEITDCRREIFNSDLNRRTVIVLLRRIIAKSGSSLRKC